LRRKPSKPKKNHWVGVSNQNQKPARRKWPVKLVGAGWFQKGAKPGCNVSVKSACKVGKKTNDGGGPLKSRERGVDYQCYSEGTPQPWWVNQTTILGNLTGGIDTRRHNQRRRKTFSPHNTHTGPQSCGTDKKPQSNKHPLP